MKAIVCIRRTLRHCSECALLAGAAWAKAEDDIRDIRGPKALATWPWVVTALVVVALLATIYGAHAIRRRRQRGARGRDLTLSERTLERLNDARPLMRPATAREFGIAVSEVVRTYIEKRFGVVATQRTTEEFLQALLKSSNEALARHRPLLAEFLQQCDFIKFAGASLAMQDLEALFASARGFVLETGEPVIA
jgi:uncharacterized protein DUF4381